MYFTTLLQSDTAEGPYAQGLHVMRSHFQVPISASVSVNQTSVISRPRALPQGLFVQSILY